ncbi:hypothetical protein [Desulforamulus ferrireducens]|uniref:Uncharacterized protein n=1 Tax=Desulforamulus ferrireducens TaxID=1833852 RepID=A0A1S6IWX2_9FIRM|nr:hypothetical protein [Desulforamulus ferrireducens]AQS59273.1 hypothetical protein B0537_09360 [Desulforamulus ferrireducens]
MLKRKFAQGFLSAVLFGSTLLGFGPSAAANIEVTTPPTQVYDQACHGKHHFQEMMRELVEQKIITQEQADQWVKFRSSKMAERKAEREKIKNMSPEERRAYWQKERPKRLDEVVKEGIITKEQAEQIKELWSKKCKQQ